MSLGLVAYDTSDESDGSDTEDPPAIVKAPALTESLPPPSAISASENSQNSKSEAQPLEAHFSDEEDDYICISSSGLNLPPPRSSRLSLPEPKEGGSSNHKLGNSQPETSNSLLAGLPAPKPSIAGGGVFQAEDDLEDIVKPKPIEIELAKEEKPPPKKRQTVKISIPSLDKLEGDNEEPVKKRPKFSAAGKSGLFALLPEPKNTSIKAAGRSLIPHTLTQKQRQAPKPAPKPPVSKPTLLSQTALPKLAGVPTDEISDDEDSSEGNFFSLESNTGDESSAPIVSAPMVSLLPNISSETEAKLGSSDLTSSTYQDAAASQSGTENAPLEFEDPMDAPLNFKNSSVPTYASHRAGHAEGYQQYNTQYEYSQPYEEAAQSELQPESDLPLPDDQLLRLQGKHKRGREEINFVNVNVDDKLAGSSIELTKGITEEQEVVSHSRKKKDQPSSQQKRKHQITYLAHKAKEREFELKNTWAENRQTKKQTQAKYGF